MTVVRFSNNRYEGLTADTKPTNVPAKSIYRDTQTNEIYEYNGSSWIKISGSLSAANTFTAVNTFDSRTQLKALASTPTDPAAGYTEVYGKVKDGSNDGIFAKVKVGGVITEYELGVADDVLTLTELADVTTTTTPADRNVLIYSSGQFINRVLAAADLPASVPFLNTANVFTAIQKISVDNGSLMTFYRPVNNAGFGGGFLYNFNNNAGTPAEVSYGNEYISIEDNTAAAHRGDFNIQLAVAAALGIRFRIFTFGNGGIIFGNNQRILVSEDGLTAQRTYTLPDSSQTLLGRTDTATVTNKTIGTTGLTFAQVAAGSVATPSAGNITLFLNSADGKLSVKDSAAAVTALY